MSNKPGTLSLSLTPPTPHRLGTRGQICQLSLKTRSLQRTGTEPWESAVWKISGNKQEGFHLPQHKQLDLGVSWESVPPSPRPLLPRALPLAFPALRPQLRAI